MTTTEPTASWVDRLNPRNWSLAWKLIAIGLVPALLALALGVLRISDQAGVAAELGASNQLLQVHTRVAATADALRQERDEAALHVAGGRDQDRSVLDAGTARTDEAVEASRAAVAAVPEGDLDGTTRAAVRQAEDGFAQLAGLREDVGGGTSTPSGAVVERYTGIVLRVDALERALLRQLRTPEVAGLTDALAATSDVREQLALQHTVLGAAIRAGAVNPPDVSASQAADTLLARAVGSYRLALTPEQVQRFGLIGDEVPAFQERDRVKRIIANNQVGQPIPVQSADWDTVHAGAVAVVQAADTGARAALGEAVVAAEEDASNLAGINSVILMLGLLAGVTIAVLVARALIRSLRVLRTSAMDVAERRLPLAVESMRTGGTPDVTVDPVPLDSRDEVGQVARAFDAVHGQAVRLAADQAALQINVSSMFVNLSRRSQALVERQLQLIEQLESNEQDPDQLSNLFQLDHLATRMRRNSENLLVLAGTDLAKRNIAPVPMVDVLRAAVSEIEQYQRIVVQAPPSASVVGRAASDLVHLLAELLDNATNFSPPDSQVVMSTTSTADGSLLVEIADRGVGMVDHELADANDRLAGPSSVDVSASRRMGLFVVGRLGARHGIQVHLATSSAGGPGAGLTASVTVPAALVPSSEGDQAARRGTAHGVPPQRVAAAAPSGALSGFVTGTDGTAAPVFEQPEAPSVNGLPTRRPGSSLEGDAFGPAPGGPNRPGSEGPDRTGPDRPGPDRDGPDRADDEADRAAAEAVAERARQDQLDAERAAAERASAVERTAAVERQEPTGRNGSHVNGVNGTAGPDGLGTPWPAAAPHPTNGSSARPPADVPVDGPPAQPGGDLPRRRPGGSAPAPAPRPEEGVDGEPFSPPTMPMPIVGRADAPAGPPPAPAPVPAATPQGLPPAESDASSLFAPAVPPEAEPPAAVEDAFPPVATLPGSMPARPADEGSGFERGETTPIFEEIASAWFRSNRPLPVEYQDEQPGPVAPAPPARPRPSPTARPVPAVPPRPTSGSSLRPPAASGSRGDAPAAGAGRENGGNGAPAPVPPRPRPEPVPAAALPPVAPPVPEPSAFATAADEGWRAAGQADPAVDRPDELTPAGLPKRRPRARLVPGSAGSAVLAPPVTPARSAESVRGRLASYQQGVRQGRETKYRGDGPQGSGSAGADDHRSVTADGNNEEST